VLFLKHIYNNVFKDFVEEVQRNVHRAIIGEGPYKLANTAIEFGVDPTLFRGMSDKIKARHINVLDPTYKLVSTCTIENQSNVINIDSDSDELHGVTPSTALPSFATTGLPKDLAETWAKVSEIITMKDGVVNMPNDVHRKIVVSFSQDNPRFVNHKNGNFDCTCPRFKEQGLCSHVMAVAFQTNQFSKFLDDLKNLTKVTKTLLPKTGGRKPNEKKRKRNDPLMRNVDEMRDENLVDMSAVNDNKNNLQLVWIRNERCTTCYGCGGKFRKLPSDPPQKKDVCTLFLVQINFDVHLTEKLFFTTSESPVSQ